MNTLKKEGQRPKSGRTKKDHPPCLIPSHLGTNIWILIIKFLGMKRDFINFRHVCRGWAQYSRQYVQIAIHKKGETAQSLKTSFEELLDASSQETKESIERAVSLKSEYEKCLELIPKKYLSFAKVSDIAKLNTPCPAIRHGIATALCLMADPKDFCGGSMSLTVSWKYCQGKLKDKNFMKCLKEAPRTLTKTKVTRFREEFRNGYGMIVQLEKESMQASHMLKWAYKLSEYLEITSRFDGEKREVFDLFDESQKELEEIENIKVWL